MYSNWWRPRTDVLEEGSELLNIIRSNRLLLANQVIVEFELPGVDAEDISLTATECTLTLTSVKNMNEHERRGNYYMKERHFGNFYRRLTLPEYVDVR